MFLGFALGSASKKLRRDRDVVMLAVGQDGLALRFTSKDPLNVEGVRATGVFEF